MVERATVETWDRQELFAESVTVQNCTSTDGHRLIGLNMHAEDRSIFCHTHFDVVAAEVLLGELTTAIAVAKQGIQ